MFDNKHTTKLKLYNNLFCFLYCNSLLYSMMDSVESPDAATQVVHLAVGEVLDPEWWRRLHLPCF